MSYDDGDWDFDPAEADWRLERRRARAAKQRRSVTVALGALGLLLIVGGLIATHASNNSDNASKTAPRHSPSTLPLATTSAPDAKATPTAQSSAESPARAATTATQPLSTTTPGTTSRPVATGIAAAAVQLRKLGVVQKPIPYSAARRAEMVTYARRHYGVASSHLDPKMIVLHFTAGRGDAYGTFAADTPAGGPAGSAAELPGTCAHFVVLQNGTIEQFVPLNLMCRHTTGLNDISIGIEMEEVSSADNILARPAQLDRALALVRVLQSAYGIASNRVIGHATANDDPSFHDADGWKNDHTDWNKHQVRAFRAQL